ncbi:hypothetical protein AVEN_259597-1 [Araneus ventricosus]|uniref:Uncharacterized protein n=1 Tax=Araneus ventricosus TaxID=182803 RepID=A0A4Y2T8T1_ARAVE|nr:hypothetical protein AVEN_259597-1 [Araneus ventricosus]
MDPISRRRSVAQQSNMLPPVALAGNNTGNIWWPRRLTGQCSKWSLLAEGNRWRYSSSNVAARIGYVIWKSALSSIVLHLAVYCICFFCDIFLNGQGIRKATDERLNEIV